MEILDGDTVLAKVLAAEERPDLAASGIGDGRHGFRVTLPPPAAESRGGRLIRARAAFNGLVFGQVVEEAPGLGAVDRLDRAASELAVLQSEIALLQARLTQRQAQARERSPLDHMAAFLAARSWRVPHAAPEDPAFAAAMAQEALHRRHPGFTVAPPPAAPAVTVVLLASPDCADTIAALRVLATTLRHENAELLLADDGRDPRTALLPSVASGLRISPPAGAGVAATLNAAADSARGGALLLLRADTAPPSGVALTGLLHRIAADTQGLLVGGAVVDCLARWGLTLPEPGPVLAAPLDVMLAVPRRRWHEAGGLDPAQEDGAGLELADLCLRLQLLGCTPRRIAAQNSVSVPRIVPDPARAWQAALRFRDIWGDLDMTAKGA